MKTHIMNNFKKNDLFLALAIGFSSALMLIFVGRNLSEENKFFEKLMPYANWLFLIFPLVCGGGIVATHFAAKIAGRALYQFGKFFLVGGFNFLLDAAILNFFLFATKLAAGWPQTGFKSASIFWSIISSYLWNKYWTFSGGSKENKGKEIYQFLAISGVGFALNVSLDYVFVNMVGSFWNMKPILWAQFSAVLAAAIAMFWNFLGYKFIVFKVKTAEISLLTSNVDSVDLIKNDDRI